jgi:hypothetical protein
MSNCYGTIDDLKARMGITSATDDSTLLALLEASSRSIDNHCHRHFYIESGTRYFDGTERASLDQILYIDDFLSLSELVADIDGDNDYTDETWAENTDWRSYPYNHYPRTRIDRMPGSDYSIIEMARLFKATGVWGYGNGSATGYKAAGVTGTVVTTTGTALTISVSAGLKAGQTILIGTEQMFVSAVTTTTATVERGVNGTTAAIHSTAAISVYQYPSDVIRLAQLIAIEAYRTDPLVGMLSESIGNYSYSRVSSITSTFEKTIDRVLSPYCRVRVG